MTGFRCFFYATVALVGEFSGRAFPAEPLRLVTTAYWGSFQNIDDDKASGFSIEVLRPVFATMGQDVSFESLPPNRAWIMVLRGERDGFFPTLRTSEQERICSFPEEPLAQDRSVLFVRTADIGILNFSSFNDLIGHDVAVLPGWVEHPGLSPELWSSLREHHNLVESSGFDESFRMLASGRVDCAVVNLAFGRREIARMGLSGKIEPLLLRSVTEEGIYVCFSRARVSPSLVEAFSRALKQFKQTEAFRTLYRKYFQ
jgi:polar amino acid transport system substrate-binding protein